MLKWLKKLLLRRVMLISLESMERILKKEKIREFNLLVELNKTPTMEEEFHRRKVRL